MMQTSPGRPDRTDRNDRPAQYDRPRFRQDDLVAESIEEQGARFIDVMDPDSGTVFRFYEVEYSLACAMDGERDVPGIVKWAQEELGLSPSPQEVRTVIAALGDLGFIATGGAQAQAQAQANDQPAHSVVSPQAKAHAPTELALGPAASGAQASASVSADAAHVAPASTAKRPVQPPASTPPPAPTPAPVQAPAQEPAQEPILTLDVDDGEPDRPLPPSGRNPARPTPGPLEPSSPSSKDISEVSIDLSDHIEVRPDDVKEAVRASRVMAAVEAPPDQDVEDMINAIDERVIRPDGAGPAPGATKPVEAKPETTRTAKQPENTRTAKQPENTRTAKPPVELPNAPNAKPVQPPAPSARMNPIFIVLLILVVLGGGGFAVWKFVLQKPDSGDTGTSPVPAPVKPTPPPPPPAPTTKVVMEASTPEDVKTNQGGVIDTIVADNTSVKEGDEIARFAGAKQIEAEKAKIALAQKNMQPQIDAWKTRLEKAQASGNKAAVDAAKAELDDREKAKEAKEAQLTAKDAELKKFQLVASGAGTFTRAVQPNTKVRENEVVGKLLRATTPTATFKVSDTKLFAANMNVEITVSKGDQPVTCTVTDVQAGSVKVVCPTDSGLTEGADVTLKSAALEAAPAPAGSDTK